MKEIDFIPDWYKADCRRRKRYVRQYAMIGILFAVTMLWSFMMGRHISNADAQVQDVTAAIMNKTSWIDKATELQQEIASMKSKSTLLEDITPRTNVSAIIGELSYLIQDNIILSKLSISENQLKQKPSDQKAVSGAVVRVSRTAEKTQTPDISNSPSRLEVIVSGIAAKPADAAGLISRMEASPYFQSVELVYSRPKKVKSSEVTEFEIRCSVADYQIVE